MPSQLELELKNPVSLRRDKFIVYVRSTNQHTSDVSCNYAKTSFRTYLEAPRSSTVYTAGKQ